MCWNGYASAAVATVGALSTAYSIYRKDSILLWATLGYFTLMEGLQAFTYTVIDRCELPSNQVATILGYLHICFQPFFINATSLYFIDKRVAKKIAPLVYIVCFAAAIMMILKLYPFDWAGHCDPNTRPMCGERICSFHGNWHIAWSMPINTIGSNISWYLIAGFIMPIAYGSWRFSLYHLFIGPVLAWFTTTNIHEWPAIWCLLSVDLLLILNCKPVRELMYVRKWIFWETIRRIHWRAPKSRIR